MATWPFPGGSPWTRHALTIPPDSLRAWVTLAVWEFWMGTVVCAVLGFGALLVVSAPDRVVTVYDLTDCYAPPPVARPCERVLYTAGVLNASFTGLCGLVLMVVALWLIWELWTAVEPKPIADDFLKLLNDSFGRDWRSPRTWPWKRVAWAYGFTLIGASSALGIGLLVWSLVAPLDKTPKGQVDTSQSFRLAQ
jgi:hypothetical protein